MLTLTTINVWCLLAGALIATLFVALIARVEIRHQLRTADRAVHTLAAVAVAAGADRNLVRVLADEYEPNQWDGLLLAGDERTSPSAARTPEQVAIDLAAAREPVIDPTDPVQVAGAAMFRDRQALPAGHRRRAGRRAAAAAVAR